MKHRATERPTAWKSCTYPGCRGRHCAGGEHRPAGHRGGFRMDNTEARVQTREVGIGGSRAEESGWTGR